MPQWLLDIPSAVVFTPRVYRVVLYFLLFEHSELDGNILSLYHHACDNVDTVFFFFCMLDVGMLLYCCVVVLMHMHCMQMVLIVQCCMLCHV